MTETTFARSEAATELSPVRMLEAELLAMPPVAALGLRIVEATGERLRLHAPLAPNINDKGCAFGGSLGSLMTLAGWGLIVLRLAEVGLDADVFVADSETRYCAPLFADLEDGELEQVALLFKERHFRAGETVVTDGALYLEDGEKIQVVPPQATAAQ